MSGSSTDVLLGIISETQGVDAATFTGGAFVVAHNTDLASGGSYQMVLATGLSELVIGNVLINTNSGSVGIEVFEDTVYDDQTGTPLPAFITDRNSALVPDVADLRVDPTISDIGTPISPLIESKGNNSSGDSRSFTFGIIFILKPSTNYTFVLAHNDGQNRTVNTYLTAYRRRIPLNETRQIKLP